MSYDDKDNVYFRDCPPPFTDLSVPDENGVRINNAYAIADMSDIKTMNGFCFETFAEIIDNGKQISVRDMNTVFNHPRLWQPEKEKEVLHILTSRVREVSEFSCDTSDDFDLGL